MKTLRSLLGNDNNRLKPTDNRLKPVCRLSLSGELLERYNSAKEASRQGGYSSTSISTVCNGKGITHKNFVWCFESDLSDVEGKNVDKNVYSLPIVQLSKKGEVVKIWDNPQQAEDESKDGDRYKCNNITGVIRGRIKTHREYVWCFKRDLKDHIGKTVSNGRYKPIIQLDMNDNIVNTYDSAIEAVKSNDKFNYVCINNVVNFRANTHAGYKWKYKEDYNDSK